MTAAADRVAAHLAARGLGPGDRLLLLAANSPEWVISLWAGLRLGAVVAPGNRWWSTDEIAHAIELTAPAVIIADTETARLLPAGPARAPARPWCPAELPLAEGMAQEADRVTDLLDSPDGREGLAAFVAKRPASFA